MSTALTLNKKYQLLLHVKKLVVMMCKFDGCRTTTCHHVRIQAADGVSQEYHLNSHVFAVRLLHVVSCQAVSVLGP